MTDTRAQRDRGSVDTEGEATGGGMPLVLHVVGLALACLLGIGLWLRSSGLDLNGGTATVEDGVVGTPATSTLPSAPAFGGARPATTGPLLAPYDPAAPSREPLAGLPGALERFGGRFTIRHPAYLPADVAPFTVNWQPDSDPARRAAGYGELYTWFYSAEHGAVLVLAQGTGVGVWPLTASHDRAGRLRLADGTEVIWVIGHPVRVTGGSGPEWEGTEVTLGVSPSDGDGWYLRSPIISLAEMIRIAESLQGAGRLDP
jgi:hypothetical protein